MAIVLDLTPEQEERLQERARAHGEEPAQYVLRLLAEDPGASEGSREGESVLDGLKRIGVVDAFKSKPRSDGRPWSEIEGYEFE